MFSWTAFLLYAASRPDTWISLVGAAITIAGIALQQVTLARLISEAERFAEERGEHEQKVRAIREQQRAANDVRRMGEIEQIVREVRHAVDKVGLPMAPARVAALIEACNTLHGVLDHPDEAEMNAFYERQQTLIDRAYAPTLDPTLFIEVGGILSELSFKADMQAAEHMHQAMLAMLNQYQTEARVKRVTALGAALSAAGFVLVLLAGLLGGQLSDFMAGVR